MFNTDSIGNTKQLRIDLQNESVIQIDDSLANFTANIPKLDLQNTKPITKNIHLITDNPSTTFEEGADFKLGEDTDFKLQEDEDSDFKLEDDADFILQEDEGADFKLEPSKERVDETLQGSFDYPIQNSSEEVDGLLILEGENNELLTINSQIKTFTENENSDVLQIKDGEITEVDFMLRGLFSGSLLKILPQERNDNEKRVGFQLKRFASQEDLAETSHENIAQIRKGELTLHPKIIEQIPENYKARIKFGKKTLEISRDKIKVFGEEDLKKLRSFIDRYIQVKEEGQRISEKEGVKKKEEEEEIRKKERDEAAKVRRLADQAHLITKRVSGVDSPVIQEASLNYEHKKAALKNELLKQEQSIIEQRILQKDSNQEIQENAEISNQLQKTEAKKERKKA